MPSWAPTFIIDSNSLRSLGASQWSAFCYSHRAFTNFIQLTPHRYLVKQPETVQNGGKIGVRSTAEAGVCVFVLVAIWCWSAIVVERIERACFQLLKYPALCTSCSLLCVCYIKTLHLFSQQLFGVTAKVEGETPHAPSTATDAAVVDVEVWAWSRCQCQSQSQSKCRCRCRCCCGWLSRGEGIKCTKLNRNSPTNDAIKFTICLATTIPPPFQLTNNKSSAHKRFTMGPQWKVLKAGEKSLENDYLNVVRFLLFCCCYLLYSFFSFYCIYVYRCLFVWLCVCEYMLRVPTNLLFKLFSFKYPFDRNRWLVMLTLAIAKYVLINVAPYCSWSLFWKWQWNYKDPYKIIVERSKYLYKHINLRIQALLLHNIHIHTYVWVAFNI